jgi:hypothetical protein
MAGDDREPIEPATDWLPNLDVPQDFNSAIGQIHGLIDTIEEETHEVKVYPDPNKNRYKLTRYLKFMEGKTDDELGQRLKDGWGEKAGHRYYNALSKAREILNGEYTLTTGKLCFVDLMRQAITAELLRRERQKNYHPNQLPAIVRRYAYGDWEIDKHGYESVHIPASLKSSGASVFVSGRVALVTVPGTHWEWFEERFDALYDPKSINRHYQSSYNWPKGALYCRLGLELGFVLERESCYVTYSSGARRWRKYEDIVPKG